MGHEQIRITVRQLREELGWSTDHLGKKAGYTNGTMINQIENGGKLPSAQKLARIAEALGVSVSALYGERARSCGVTNTANGEHQTVYQYGKEVLLMGEGAERTIRDVVREELQRSREMLMAEFRTVLQETVRDAQACQADDEPGPEP